jgi:uncharacterized membrane protein YfcA
LDYLIIGIASVIASGLTLFSGFGLGTMLLPAFALFFPLDMAIGMTAIVHLLNNLFKMALLGKYADKHVVLRFGIPAILAAFVGAWMLLWFADFQPIASYSLNGNQYFIEPVKLAIGILIIVFAFFELLPVLKKLSFDMRFLPLGGLLSGFFGGLSGHQGALRSAFLLRCGLEKESFIATGVVLASLVDFSRLFIYSTRFTDTITTENFPLLLTAVLCAFLGVFIASRLLKKVTMKGIQILISVLLFAIAIGLIFGFI